MIKVMQCVMHSQMFVLRVTRPLWSGARLFKYRASVPQVLFDKLVLWQHLNRKPRHICHQFAVIVIQQPIIVLISFHHFPLQLTSANPLTTLLSTTRCLPSHTSTELEHDDKEITLILTLHFQL